MKSIRKFIVNIMFCTFFLVVISLMPIKVQAANGTITFGSLIYEKTDGEEFPVGIYVRGDSNVTEYRVELRYDPQRLKYVSGAQAVDEDNGILTFYGNVNGAAEAKMWLVMQAQSGGSTNLEVVSGSALNGAGEQYIIADYMSVEVSVAGEDKVALAEEEARRAEEEAARIAAEEAKKAEEEAARLAAEEEARIETERQAQLEADRLAAEEMERAAIEREKQARAAAIKRTAIIIVAVLMIVFALLAIVITLTGKKNKNINRGSKEKTKKQLITSSTIENKFDDLVMIDLDSDEIDDVDENAISETSVVEKPSTDDENLSSDKIDDNRELVIKVDDVTMRFMISTSNASGIKEYIIQKIKGQVKHRELLALNHVSFDVYKGEVVGIIGTNGSGKSTLLKIISGALGPTSGKVYVDRRKIQILTLGTGFDMELSARENVYLNGSIIGYSKEFLDKHYDEIVDFAELEGFMEEKVKNFSSGMVARLGFAIATAGQAAEILILDEVLSVGDEFFKKKSLKRIKEMIHGGSTVLMVSHGMGTILDNCTKAVWIEKGVLKMIGDPDIVCGAYRNYKE